MDSPTLTTEQTPILICYGCARLLTAAYTASRRHVSQMSRAIQWANNHPSEAHEQQVRAEVAATFNQALPAFDACREHVRKHGNAQRLTHVVCTTAFTARW